MEIDFSKNQTGEGSVPVTENHTTAIVKAPELPMTAPAQKPAQKPALSEIILPRISLVHSVGVLKDSFPVGSFVHNSELVLYTAPQINVRTQTVEKAGSPPLNVTFLDVYPVRYFEKVPGGGRGLILDTEDAVRRAGGTTSYNEWKLKEKDGMRRFDLGCDCLLAIERPELAADDGTVFVFPVGESKYALALYRMKGSAFTVLKKSVNTARVLGCLRDGIANYSWSLASRLEPTPDKSSTYWKPTLTPARKSTPEFLEWAKSVLAAPRVESAEPTDE